MRRKKQRYRSSAQSIIETVVGIIFLIPIVLLMFDVGVLILANTSNDNLAKQAARAAASAPGAVNAQPGAVSYFNNARTAAQEVVRRYKKNTNPNGMWAGADLVYMAYHDRTVTGSPTGTNRVFTGGPKQPPANATQDPGLGNVAVVTLFRVQCPVAFPGFDGEKEFFAKAVEPITSQPPF